MWAINHPHTHAHLSGEGGGEEVEVDFLNETAFKNIFKLLFFQFFFNSGEFASKMRQDRRKMNQEMCKMSQDWCQDGLG